MLGRPLMAWQQHVANVILEIDPVTGELVYDEYRLTVPRQSGKSTFILSKAVHRCSATRFFGTGQQMVYLAQTRKDSRKKFVKEYAAALEQPGAKRFQIRPYWGHGEEHFGFPNRSAFGIEANTEKSGHGSVLDEAVVDEAFSQVDNRAEQAVGPAMITRRNKQLGIISTAGWLNGSPYLWGKVEDGRRLVALQLIDPLARRGTAYFEWSAPDEADPGDERVWLACMPAVHRPECPPDCTAHTIRLSAIRSEYEKAQRSGKLSDFRRAYLNQWRKKPKEGEETALGNWSRAQVRLTAEDVPGPKAFGVAVSHDRAWSSIGYCGLREDGAPLVAPLTDGRRPGVDWLGPEAARLSKTYGVPVVVDVGGPAGEDVALAIERAGGRVIRAKLPEFIAACADLYDRVNDLTGARVQHTDSKVLNDAVGGARWRPVGDGRRVFGRQASESDISMLEAVALACWATTHGRTYDVLDSIG